MDNWASAPEASSSASGSAGPSSSIPFSATAPDKWSAGTVSIPMPCLNSILASEDSAPQLIISDVWHHKLTEVIRSAFEDPSFLEFDIKAFKYFWKPSEDEPAQHVYGETYYSNRALELEEQLYLKTFQESPNPDPSEPEHVIAWIQLWSDLTHLAEFGTASLWPIYLYFGNLSKYTRGKGKSHAAHYIAYIPLLPDLIKDIYKQEFGIKPTDAVKRFLKRDLMSAIW
ncbi:hypothetical protein BT96DRAFT_988388 [Gymnopus androsaceus JB14]|uniref:Uncharacterized protein n=1 Tax=Gymnopus androsaceus JB14 TaxID=1447944 RepID=A0A6A4I1I4_9AGAR|nr:hypothetical protein BT96DRAFT_988388 [Gymnopus androsaceus JB14]